MNLGYRIKASEEDADIQALEFVRGIERNGKFIFSNDAQYNSYDEIRRRIRGGESLEAIAKSYNIS